MAKCVERRPGAVEPGHWATDERQGVTFRREEVNAGDTASGFPFSSKMIIGDARSKV